MKVQFGNLCRIFKRAVEFCRNSFLSILKHLLLVPARTIGPRSPKDQRNEKHFTKSARGGGEFSNTSKNAGLGFAWEAQETSFYFIWICFVDLEWTSALPPRFTPEDLSFAKVKQHVQGHSEKQQQIQVWSSRLCVPSAVFNALQQTASQNRSQSKIKLAQKSVFNGQIISIPFPNFSQYFTHLLM